MPQSAASGTCQAPALSGSGGPQRPSPMEGSSAKSPIPTPPQSQAPPKHDWHHRSTTRCLYLRIRAGVFSGHQPPKPTPTPAERPVAGRLHHHSLTSRAPSQAPTSFFTSAGFQALSHNLPAVGRTGYQRRLSQASVSIASVLSELCIPYLQ